MSLERDWIGQDVVTDANAIAELASSQDKGGVLNFCPADASRTVTSKLKKLHVLYSYRNKWTDETYRTGRTEALGHSVSCPIVPPPIVSFEP